MLLHISDCPCHLLQIGNLDFLRIGAALLCFYAGLQVNYKAQIGLDEQKGGVHGGDAIAQKRDNMDEYDTIFVGFPIWWYVAPTIINTFLESYDLKGKTIIPFATSGGSDMGKTNEKLAPSCPGAKLLHGKVFNSYYSKADLSAWVEALSL